MNRNILLLVLIGVFGSAATVFAAETTVTLAVENMTCALCPVTVRKAIERVEGVIDTKVDLNNKTATVIYDDARTTPQDIAKASTNVGFAATQI
tara:strand:+ start:2709 stop:2990 length:282 start_codon:yes stop_codon:yes gene_type:complete